MNEFNINPKQYNLKGEFIPSWKREVNEVIAGEGECKLSEKALELYVNKIKKIDKLKKGMLIKTFDTDRKGYKLYIYSDKVNVYCYIMFEDEIVCLNEAFIDYNKQIDDITFKKCILENQIYTLNEFRKDGLTTITYECLLENGYQLMSSPKQYDGTRKIWKKLSKKYTVSVFDEALEQFMFKKYNIKFTAINNLDNNIWSLYPDFSCESTFLIVYK